MLVVKTEGANGGGTSPVLAVPGLVNEWNQDLDHQYQLDKYLVWKRVRE
jgi:hypothetical protein